MEQLAVQGTFSVAASGSMSLEVKAGHRSTQTVPTKEEGERVQYG